MNLYFNIIIICWLLSISICVFLVYRDMIRVRYTKEAKDIAAKPGKGFVVPGSGFFTIKEKKSAIVNDDGKAWKNEMNQNDRAEP